MQCVLTVTSEGISVKISGSQGTHEATLIESGWSNPDVAAIIGERTDVMAIQEVLEDFAGLADPAVVDVTENDPPLE